MAVATATSGGESSPRLSTMLQPDNMFVRLAWQGYSLARLVLQPHGFFQRLYGLAWYRNVLDDWLAWLNPPPGSHILEVGCSSGGFSAALAQRGYRVTAVDRSARAIQHARQLRPAGQLQFIVADAMHLPLRQPFHYTLAASLLNVVDTPHQLIAEMVRLTAANGSVSFLFPTPAMQSATAAHYIAHHQLHGFSAAALSLWARLAHKLEPAAVTSMLHDTGLTHVRRASLLDGMVAGVAARLST